MRPKGIPQIPYLHNRNCPPPKTPRYQQSIQRLKTRHDEALRETKETPPQAKEMQHYKRKSIIAWVPTQSIIYAKRSKDWPKYLKYWPLLSCPGNWDLYGRHLEPFRERELKEILMNGQDYKISESYTRLKRELKEHGRTRFPRCHSENQIDEYFKGLASLYENIRLHGCMPAQETGADGDISVRISRTGELLKCGQGTHRLAISRLLGLKSVPVCIDIIHTKWVSQCKQNYNLKKRFAIEQWLSEISTEK